MCKKNSLENFVKNKKFKKINVLKTNCNVSNLKSWKDLKNFKKKCLIDVLVLEMIVATTYKNQNKINDIFQML